MVRVIVILSFAVSSALCRTPLSKMFPERPPLVAPQGTTGDALFLTPYLEKNEIGLARHLSLVDVNEKSIPESYTGYITVNKNLGSNMFFWFFPAAVSGLRARQPLLLWLQGGPGGSSLFGLFVEHGPVYVNKDLKVLPRKYPWTAAFSVLYVDNPVGTGFSFTKNSEGYARNEDDVARDLYEFLGQFFTLFPELRKADFYITGESYAGKYVPALSFKIHIENRVAGSKRINLKGMAIGDGLCDPVSMLDYEDYLYQIGLIDSHGREYMSQRHNDIKQLINNDREVDYIKAFKEWDKLLNGDKYAYGSSFRNLTGFRNYFNYLYSEGDGSDSYYEAYLNTPMVRRGIHVGNLPYNNGSVVEDYLISDILKSVRPRVLGVLNADYKVMLYSGQLDIIVAYPLTENFLLSLDDWKLHQNYTEANRNIWRVDGEIAGYAKAVGNFTEVLVRNAGHMVPKDQSKWAFDLIHRFILGKPFA